ncbi:MAG: A/G-specific adenine glycosylase [Theionarchaea archaeon]|nr:A/G-specific adenine glycosylase [Theionarchaea archaeon]
MKGDTRIPGKEKVTLEDLIRKDGVTQRVISMFQTHIYGYYQEKGRIFPWRDTDNPYCILVSEIMLQQTQTERVIQKYNEFTTLFPDFPSLARAPLQKVLEVWHGLGYNKRAKALKKTAEIVTIRYNGVLPSNTKVLQTFPGIGKATAGAISAFAFHNPVSFIETNIRTVFIYFFFQGETSIKDKDILPLVEKTLDTTNPREWYYALTDYGVMLKKSDNTLNKRSFHYQKQPPFKGSNRQIRGTVLKVLLGTPYTESELTRELTRILHCSSERVMGVLDQLEKEGFITRKGCVIRIS